MRLPHHTLQRKFSDDSIAAGFAKPAGHLRTLQDLHHGGGEFVGISWRNEQAGFSIFYNFRIAADVGSDHRKARGHGFEQNIRKSLAHRRKYKEIRLRQNVEYVRTLSQKAHVLTDPQIRS